MNGIKLGTNQKPKNSFIYQNQFIGYGDSSNPSGYVDEDDHELYSQSNRAQSKKLPSQKHSHQINMGKQQQGIKKQEQKQKKQVKNASNMENKEVKKQIQVKKQNKKQGVEDRISNINKGISKLSVSIHQMKDNYDDLSAKQMELKRRNEKKQAEIKQFLQKKYEQKQNILERKKIQQEKDKRKLQQSLKLEEEAKEAKSKNKIEEHLRRLNEMREKRSAQKQKAAENNKIVSQLFEKLSAEQKKQKFHLRKMQQDRIKKQKELEHIRSILAERKNAYRSIDVAELQDHQRKHDEVLQQLREQKRAKRQSEIQRIQQQNIRFEDIHRGIFHDYIEEEIYEKKIKKGAIKERVKKVKQYENRLKQKFLPKTHQPSAKKHLNYSLNNRSSLSNREIRRYRYLNGVAYGQVIEFKPQVLSEKQQRQLGNENLAYLRSLPKKKIIEKEQQLSPEDLAILDKKLNSIVRVKKQKNPLYERVGNRSTQLKISQNPTRDEVNMIFGQLRSKDQQTKMKQKVIKYQQKKPDDLSYINKQINDSIVKTIQQKLNLLAKI